jgi:hypothetical protein
MDAAEMSLWRRLYYTRFRDVLRGRFDASLDREKIVADAGLPSELADTITLVVRRSKLWRSEQVDVAKELVAHFQDGLTSGQSPQQLIESFGDPQQAAQLIRRAKKRGRSIVWHFWHYGWTTVTAIAGIYIVVGVYQMTGRPTLKTDYLALLNQAAVSVPESKRAWPLYREALLTMGVKGDPGNSDSKLHIPAYDANSGDADWPKLAQFLNDHADSIAKLRDAAARHDLGFVSSTSFAAFTPEDRELFGVTISKGEIEAYKSQTLQDRWLISTLLPYLQSLRAAAVLLKGDAQRAALAGEADTAMADTLALLGIARHCRETPFLVNFLVAVAVQGHAEKEVRNSLAREPTLWSNQQLADLAHAIAAAKVDWRRGFTCETNDFYDVMQRLYTDDGHGDGRLAFRSSFDQNIFQLLNSLTSSGASDAASFYANDPMAMLMLPAANMVVASRKEMTEMYLRFLDSRLALIETPFWKGRELIQPDEHALSDDAGPIEHYRYLFLRLLAPATEKLRNTIVTSDGRRDGVLIGIALELYHREHGEWAKSLDELSPRWLPSVPVDRITGEPLHYKIVDDRPVVYSVGIDRDDDGGRAPLDGAGKADEELASPNSLPNEKSSVKPNDGDWIIWSTVPSNSSMATPTSGDST